MKCPVCANVNLVMSERQGVEIDYCPECRGVWLDRGELDKIIERAAQQEPVLAQQPRYEPQPNSHPHAHAPGMDTAIPTAEAIQEKIVSRRAV